MNTKTKTCCACGINKPREAFSKKTASPDGLVSKCRACQAEYWANWEKRKQHNSSRADRPSSPSQPAAGRAVSKAIRRGELSRAEACEDCGRSDLPIDAHHDDYARPLDVRWLCRSCHTAWHHENGPGRNRD